MSGRATRRPSIQRWYKADGASCVHALKFLLTKATRPSAPNEQKADTTRAE